MKHKLVTVICFVIIIVLGSLVALAYRDGRARAAMNEARTAAIRATDQARAQLRQAAQQAVVQKEKARLLEECTKEEAYYATLTPAQKAKQPAPDCRNLNMVE